MWTIVISLIFYFSFIKRRWYNGQHSCLPSSWSGFDSRPTQLFSSAHIYWEKRGSPVVYWSRRLTSVWKFGGSNPVLGECFWANDLNKWSGTHYSRRKLWILNPLMSRSIIAYNWLVSWHVWGVRIRTGKTLGLGKASLIGARRHSNVSSVKNLLREEVLIRIDWKQLKPWWL